MSADFRLGIQSYCFRNFRPLNELIESVKKVGLSYLELWPGHQGADTDPSELQRMLDTLTESGITLESYGNIKFTADEQAGRNVFEFCRMAGIRAVTADVDPEAVELTEGLCDEYDINLAIHNHGRAHRYGKMAQLDELFGRTSKRFGLCLDAAWTLDAGEDPLEAVDRYKERLYGVHLKDFSFDKEGNHQDVIIGTGGLDLPRLMSMLEAMNYRGYLSLEYEGNPADPFEEITECVQVVQDAIAAL